MKLTPGGKISKEYLQTLLPHNPIIIEAGAHIGRDTVKMKNRWPQSTIHSFEPVPHLFEELTKNTKNLSNVHRYPYALSATSGTQIMHISNGRGDACSSLLQPDKELINHPEITFNTTTVQTITLDEWAQQNNIKHVDFLWLDLQGNELKALQGAEQLLHNVSVIQVEINTTQRYKHGVLYPELLAWLEAHGFILDTKTLFKTTWGDALFVKHIKHST